MNLFFGRLNYLNPINKLEATVELAGGDQCLGAATKPARNSLDTRTTCECDLEFQLNALLDDFLEHFETF